MTCLHARIKKSILLRLRYPEEVKEGEDDLDEEVVLGKASGRGRAVPDGDGHVVLVPSSTAVPAPLGRLTGVLFAAAGFDPEGAPEVLPEEHEDERVEHCHCRREKTVKSHRLTDVSPLLNYFLKQIGLHTVV